MKQTQKRGKQIREIKLYDIIMFDDFYVSKHL